MARDVNQFVRSILTGAALATCVASMSLQAVAAEFSGVIQPLAYATDESQVSHAPAGAGCAPCPTAEIPPHPWCAPGESTDSALDSPGDNQLAPEPPADVFDSTDFSTTPTSFASTGNSGSLAPGMTGDFLFLGQQFSPLGVSSAFLPVGGDAITRYKTSVNGSPLPSDRVFLTVHHHHSIPTGIGSTYDITTSTLGIEKTLGRCRRSSIEFRLPWASTTNAFDSFDSSFNEVIRLGDVSLALKHLLYRDSRNAFSCGLGITLPTADGLEAGSVTVENDTVHLQPFFGWLATPNPMCFTQAFVGFDFDAGSKEYADGSTSFELNDQSLFFASLSQGCWLCGDYRCGRWQHGVAALFELHYSTTIESAETFSIGTGSVATFDQSHLNLVPGILVQIRPQTDARLSAGMPLLSDSRDQRAFDTEVIFQFNQRF